MFTEINIDLSIFFFKYQMRFFPVNLQMAFGNAIYKLFSKQIITNTLKIFTFEFGVFFYRVYLRSMRSPNLSCARAFICVLNFYFTFHVNKQSTVCSPFISINSFLTNVQRIFLLFFLSLRSQFICFSCQRIINNVPSFLFVCSQVHSHTHLIIMWVLSYLSVFISDLNCKLIHTKDTAFMFLFLIWYDFPCFALWYYNIREKCFVLPLTQRVHNVHTHIKKNGFAFLVVLNQSKTDTNIQMIFSIHHKMSIKHSSYFKQSFTLLCHNFLYSLLKIEKISWFDRNFFFCSLYISG